MLMGHYSVALAARRTTNTIPLWVWFVAVQWLDLFFMVFVLAGIEKMRLTPGFTESNDLDLYFMPYSHGLIGATVLSLGFAVLVATLMPAARRPAVFALLALASFSHWILDLVVHTPDLPLFDTQTKVGFGLWNHLAVEFPVELALLAVGVWICSRALTEGAHRRRLWIVAAAMIGLQVYGTFGPTAHSTTALAITALVAYMGLIAAAWWIERPSPTSVKSISSAP